jgi:hypothetical protein
MTFAPCAARLLAHCVTVGGERRPVLTRHRQGEVDAVACHAGGFCAMGPTGGGMARDRDVLLSLGFLSHLQGHHRDIVSSSLVTE